MLSLLLLLTFTAASLPAEAFHPGAVHGDILEVHAEERKVRVAAPGGLLILELRPDCRLVRGCQPVTASALRPVKEGWYQDALFVLDSEGRVVEAIVNYTIREEAGFLVLYDIFGNIKMQEPI